MSERDDVKPASRPKAIDVYDNRVRAVMDAWMAELREQNDREQARLAARTRTPRA